MYVTQNEIMTYGAVSLYPNRYYIHISLTEHDVRNRGRKTIYYGSIRVKTDFKKSTIPRIHDYPFPDTSFA